MEGVTMFDWDRFLRPDIFVLCIPIAGILVGGVIVIVRMVIVHREHLAMIERGMDPRDPPEEDDE